MTLVRLSIGALSGWLREMDTLKLALVAQFTVSVAFGLMQSFMPLFINKDLGESLISSTYWSSISNFAWFGGMAITAPIWGWVCDRVGTKRVLVIVLAGNILTYAGMAFSVNVVQLVAFRIVQSLFGGLSTILFVVVGIVSPPNKLREQLGLQIAGSTIGNLLSPGVGGTIASFLGYRMTILMQGVIFVALYPLILKMKTAKPAVAEKVEKFSLADLKSMLPTAGALICAYACIGFINPTIPWFLSSLGVDSKSLLLWTTLTTILNGTAFAIATPILTKRATGRTLTIFQVLAAVVIEATAFAFNPVMFIVFRVGIGVIQAGLPANLLGGKSATKGQGMGLLNSARYIGTAIGPVIASTILGDGTPPKPLYMFSAIAGISLLSAVITYTTRANED
ncbi:MAG: MFS transporter [Candidatus Bathyarchaeota archaeon]|nr:MFS transporter [Candidatus Bathyarchaeota archaeon]